ncbi:MbnP family copper-binding protein [Chitinibacter sp. ZOR0017]|uniref:MbnP family copper-binding protein n=1 Tax=Chitinibacter sp. ZOR0017 TaxID=1339254 RepID=UPI000A9AE315|nr:MbnP family copper-binding protein [Chitinibacter sp. ZOR0017]
MMKKTTLAVSLGLIALLSACGGAGDTAPVATPTPVPTAAPTPAPQAVNIQFVAKAGTEAVKCGTPITSLGNPSTAAQLQDLRLYLSNVVLLTADNREVPLKLASNEWQNSEVALIDLEDGTGSCSGGTSATNAKVSGEVPAGSYTGLKMTVGVPSSLNHTDYATASAPMNVQAMAWSWQSGRKFAKIEVTDPQGVAGSWTAKTFMVHLGSTGCTGNPATGATTTCTSSNRMDVKLSSFNPATQNVVIDLQTLLATSNVMINGGGAPGCMSGKTDPECPAIFSALKIDLNAGTSINGGDGQQLFRVEAK